VGIFAFLDGAVTSEKEEQFVQVNGSSILYGAAREFLRSMTTLGPWGSAIIPGVSFYEQQASLKEEMTPVAKAD
jgi:precorrin-4 methylase